MRDSTGSFRDGRRREPALNVPPVLAGLVLLLVAAHAARLAAGLDADRFAFTSTSLERGDWPTIVSYVFVHASWAHVLMNALFSLAFGAPVVRLLGSSWRGAAAFVLFYLVCGALAALGYAAWREGAVLLRASPHPWALVGASGAASGLMGAAGRLMDGRGGLGEAFGRRSVTLAAAWIAANVLLGLSGLTPGAAGMPVAWEAHIMGFFAGLALIGPAARLAGVRGDPVSVT